MKKITFLTLALVVVLGLFPALAGPQSTHAQDTVEITFVHIFPDERDVRRELIAELAATFMVDHPGVVVNIETTTADYGDVFEGALLAAQQGNAPHVIQVEDSLTQIAIDSQMFVKIGDYATEEQLAQVADIIPAMRNFYNLDEEIWGMPWNASNPVMYYNPDIFEAAGLPTSPPRTFAEITQACEAIMAAGIDKLEGCINWPVNSWLPEQWVSMQNALFVNNENGRDGRATETFLNSPEMLNILTWWKDLADNGYFIYSGTPGDYYSEGLMFVTKKTAIMFSTSAGISNTIKFGGLMGQFEPVVAPLPFPNEEATNGVTAGGGALWVLAGHSEAETRAAVDFVFFMLTTDNMSAWHKASGYYPILQSSIDQLTDEGWFEENPAYRVPLDQLLGVEPNAANAGMVIGAAAQVRGAVVDAALSVIDGGEDPAAALDAAKQRADKAVEDYNDLMG